LSDEENSQTDNHPVFAESSMGGAGGSNLTPALIPMVVTLKVKIEAADRKAIAIF
jgi:hypothetical protein